MLFQAAKGQHPAGRCDRKSLQNRQIARRPWSVGCERGFGASVYSDNTTSGLIMSLPASTRPLRRSADVARGVDGARPGSNGHRVFDEDDSSGWDPLQPPRWKLARKLIASIPNRSLAITRMASGPGRKRAGKRLKAASFIHPESNRE